MNLTERVRRVKAEAAVAEARVVPEGWADQVEQRLLTWQQRKMNRSGDRLALNDFMGQDSIDDLIDCVCAPLDCGEAGHDEGRCGNASCLAATTSPAEQPKPVDEAACRARCDYCGDDWPCAKQRADEQPKPEVRDLLLEARDTLCSMTTVGTYVDDLIRRIDAALSGEQP